MEYFCKGIENSCSGKAGERTGNLPGPRLSKLYLFLATR